MIRLAALATTALVTFAFPAFADNATITQTNESISTATQHQPGTGAGMATNDSAVIVQQTGSNDSASQEQARLSYAQDFAYNSTQSITQTGNGSAQAGQTDNGVGDSQAITQTSTVAGTSANQSVDT